MDVSLTFKDKKKGQATFLPAFMSCPRLRSIDVRLSEKYEKKQPFPLSFFSRGGSASSSPALPLTVPPSRCRNNEYPPTLR